MTREKELIEEAKIRGFKPGIKINNSNLNGTIGEARIFEEIWQYDQGEHGYFLRLDGHKVWYEGKWAEIVTEELVYSLF